MLVRTNLCESTLKKVQTTANLTNKTNICALCPGKWMVKQTGLIWLHRQKVSLSFESRNLNHVRKSPPPSVEGLTYWWIVLQANKAIDEKNFHALERLQELWCKRIMPWYLFKYLTIKSHAGLSGPRKTTKPLEWTQVCHLGQIQPSIMLSGVERSGLLLRDG